MTSKTSGPGDGLIRGGAILFLVGALATLITFVPLFLGLTPLPSAAYWASMTMPLGFLIALGGMLRSVLAQRDRVDATARPQPIPSDAR